jgi:DNA-binding response OmpR family regulator
LNTESAGKTFLVIEDNPADAALIRQAFDALAACKAFVCRNLSEAKAYLHGSGMYSDRTKYPFPNAVICDLNLCGESGVEFAAWLKSSSNFEKMPIVILTGSSSEDDITAARRRGAISVLRKPARFEELRAMLADTASKLCS